MDVKPVYEAARGGLTFKKESFEEMTMEQGFYLLLFIGLILGIVSGVAAAIQGVPTTEEVIAEGFEGAEEMPFFPYVEYYIEQMPTFERLARETEALAQEKSVPALEIVGRTVVSGAFAFISTWLLLGALVYITAKGLGGTANLQTTLAATSLWAVPHLLKVGEEIPYLGRFLSAVAFLWGLLIYVQAVRVVHGLDRTKSVLALLIPAAVPLIGVILTVLVLMAL
jgi:hypothetical protein